MQISSSNVTMASQHSYNEIPGVGLGISLASDFQRVIL